MLIYLLKKDSFLFILVFLTQTGRQTIDDSVFMLHAQPVPQIILQTD